MTRRVVLLLAALPATAAAEPRSYTLDPEASVVRIDVGRSGLFAFAGHRHEVVAPRFRGTVRADPADLSASSVEVVFESAALRVTGRGEPPAEVPKVQEAMTGPKVLDVARFPEIAFRSQRVGGRATGPGVYELALAGELTLHGVTRPFTVPLRVELKEDELVASGQVTLRQKDFGIQPLSVGGVVNVKNELGVDFRLVGRRAQ